MKISTSVPAQPRFKFGLVALQQSVSLLLSFRSFVFSLLAPVGFLIALGSRSIFFY